MSQPASTVDTLVSQQHTAEPVVQELTPALTRQWDAFVESCPDGTFFHLAGWKEVIETAFGHRGYYLLATSADEITGVLPLIHISSRLFGNALISVPFCAYGGVATANATVRTSLETTACALAERLKVDYLELRNRQARHPDWPCKQLYVTFRKTLDADPDANLLAIPRKQRAMVRKGIKAGLDAGWDDGIDRLYAAYSESVRNLGTPVFSKHHSVMSASHCVAYQAFIDLGELDEANW